MKHTECEIIFKNISPLPSPSILFSPFFLNTFPPLFSSTHSNTCRHTETHIHSIVVLQASLFPHILFAFSCSLDKLLLPHENLAQELSLYEVSSELKLMIIISVIIISVSPLLKFYKFLCRCTMLFFYLEDKHLRVGTILLLQYILWTNTKAFNNCSVTQKGLKCIISIPPHSFCSLMLGEPSGSHTSLYKFISLFIIPLGYKYKHNNPYLTLKFQLGISVIAFIILFPKKHTQKDNHKLWWDNSSTNSLPLFPLRGRVIFLPLSVGWPYWHFDQQNIKEVIFWSR